MRTQQRIPQRVDFFSIFQYGPEKDLPIVIDYIMNGRRFMSPGA